MVPKEQNQQNHGKSGENRNFPI